MIQVSHKYTSLRMHIAKVHPDLLPAFETGWEALGPKLRAIWLKAGILTTNRKYDHWRRWDSWIKVRYSLPYETKSANCNEKLAIIIQNTMEHTGSLFGIPELPQPKENPRLFPQDNLKKRIADKAAKIMLQTEMAKVFERLKGEI